MAISAASKDTMIKCGIIFSVPNNIVRSIKIHRFDMDIFVSCKDNPYSVCRGKYSL